MALADGAAVDPGSVRRYANRSASGLGEVLIRYLEDTGAHPDQIVGVCVAAAGPVHDGIAELTNLDWRIDRDVLSETLTAEHVAVLNDLQAQGHAIGLIEDDNLISVVERTQPNPHAVKLVVGVGTGFNAAPVYDTAAGRFVPPSECGHTSLPFCGEDSTAFLKAMRKKYSVAQVEEALSGRGIAAIHHHLHGVEAEPASIMADLEAGEDRAEATIDLFVRFLGTVVGDLALVHLPFGGIFLVGGVARSVAPHLARFGFKDTMRDKGRFGSFMEQFGVSVVTDDFAALRGCAAHLKTLRDAA